MTPHKKDPDAAYFGYYAQFVHQQNMLQDRVRTSVYHEAIAAQSASHFYHRTVLDLGAGSGILSYFAVRAGASKVYAVEASGMARHIQRMVDAAAADGGPAANAWLRSKVTVVPRRIEDVDDAEVPERVDTIVSEPIGVLLVHERMLESLLVARDRFLKPAPHGRMLPNAGTLFLAPFSDAQLWLQTEQKAVFWQNRDFFGVDWTPLVESARLEAFAVPVVGGFDPHMLVSTAASHTIDFETATVAEISRIEIPLDWTAAYTGLVHGIAGWFDVSLGSVSLTTRPSAPRTHWQQIRFLLEHPLAVNAGERLCGRALLVVNELRSYDLTVEVAVDGAAPASRSGKWALQDQTYWYPPDPTGPTSPQMYSLYPSGVSAGSLLDGVSLTVGGSVVDVSAVGGAEG